jgi:hypothetical protein
MVRMEASTVNESEHDANEEEEESSPTARDTPVGGFKSNFPEGLNRSPWK